MLLNANTCRNAASGFAPMARKLAAILACVPVSLSAAPALAPAGDLAADAKYMRREQVPMVVLYSRADCPWCDQARAYLVPMAKNPATRKLARYRQIDLDTERALTDFAGRRTTHRRFADERKVALTPTVVLYDADGRQLGDPIVGMRLPDFYGQYLEQAIDNARRTLQHAPRPSQPERPQPQPPRP